jgi:DNA-binding MurR/RpiR family transcriptional regulator
MGKTGKAEDMSFDERIDAALPSMSPAEQKIAAYFRTQKEAILLNSAIEIAEKAGVSDATVVRAARTLGFEGLSGLREAILSELTGNNGQERRLQRTLDEVKHDSSGVLDHVLKAHRESLEVMSSAEFAKAFALAVNMIFSARHRFIFGIGPSGSVADYAALQFNRLGLSTTALADSGVKLADGLIQLAEGDAILMIANAPVYREVSVILDHAEKIGVPVVLIGDSLAPYVRKRVTEILPVPRGRADHLSMHGATIVLVEAMIVALADKDRDAAFTALAKLGALRGSIDKLWLKRGTKTR